MEPKRQAEFESFVFADTRPHAAPEPVYGDFWDDEDTEVDIREPLFSADDVVTVRVKRSL